MSNQRKKGNLGEAYARKWLQEHAYTLLEQNYRKSYHEVDIIAQKGRKVHFIEVKTRWTNTFGYPEESVDRRKFRSMQEAAAAYMDQLGYFMPIQFDILSIRYNGCHAEVVMIEDVYFFK